MTTITFYKPRISCSRNGKKIQNMIGRPSTKSYINCPITENDVRNAEVIFGPNLGSLEGKTVQQTPEQVSNAHSTIPRQIMEYHCDVTLCVDVMFVNQIPCFVTISRKLKFSTAIPNCKRESIMKGIKNVNSIYVKRGFRIRLGLMDNEFQPLRADFIDVGIGLNVTSNDEHVPEVEQYIRTIQEQTQATYNTLPINKCRL
jgi:hypothetical protein